MRILTVAEVMLGCPVCPAQRGEPCRTATGKEATRPHKARGMVVTHVSLLEPLQAAEDPTTGRLDPNDVVVPGETPIFEALVAERMRQKALERGLKEIALYREATRRLAAGLDVPMELLGPPVPTSALTRFGRRLRSMLKF